MMAVDSGCFVICCEVSEGVNEFLVGQKMKASLVIMASKDHIEGLKLKYDNKFHFEKFIL